MSKPFIVKKTTVSIGGVTYNLKEMSMSINRGVKDDAYYVGSTKLDYVSVGETEISGSFTVTSDDVTEFVRSLYGSTTGTTTDVATSSLSTASLDVTLQTPDASKSMTISIPSMIYPKGGFNLTNNEPVGKSFDWRAIGSNITVVIQ